MVNSLRSTGCTGAPMRDGGSEIDPIAIWGWDKRIADCATVV
jgi:hypothetical protein